MSRIAKYFLCIISIYCSQACKKSSDNEARPAASINVINATGEGALVNVNFTTTPIYYALYLNPIPFGANYEWTLPTGADTITLVSSIDTSKIFFSTTDSFVDRGIYSMYVFGTSSKDEVLLMRDTIPTFSDSSAGCRFINLSPDSGPITINLEGNDPSQTEFGPLSYKQISSFKKYDATSSAMGYYNFEVRDKVTQTLLTTFAWPYMLQRCHTIVICGYEDPSAGPTSFFAFPVKNF